jgi:hypothetical protein
MSPWKWDFAQSVRTAQNTARRHRARRWTLAAARPMRLSRMRTVPVRALAIFAVLLTALPVGAGRDQYFCRAMGRLMDSCCCASARAAAKIARSGASEVKAKDCCERVSHTASAGAPALKDGSLRVPPAALCSVAPMSALLTVPNFQARGVRRVQARAPPRRPPCLYLENCSLLT